ncbi:MAG: hypothetical protein WC824_12145 [Bacteroidota bacterium]|jgi:hypothetical protein
MLAYFLNVPDSDPNIPVLIVELRERCRQLNCPIDLKDSLNMVKKQIPHEVPIWVLWKVCKACPGLVVRDTDTGEEYTAEALEGLFRSLAKSDKGKHWTFCQQMSSQLAEALTVYRKALKKGAELPIRFAFEELRKRQRVLSEVMGDMPVEDETWKVLRGPSVPE